MIVYCRNGDCISCVDGICERECITIAEGFCECEDYESYQDSSEYQCEYFVCVKIDNSQIAKSKRKGKKIEFNGRIFYTMNDDRYPESMVVTDARTGVAIGFQMLKENWEKYMEKSNDLPDVNSFPLAEWDEEKRAYFIQPGFEGVENE